MVHFIGIGGSGMSSLAILLHRRGVVVTGSDIVKSKATARLESLGVKVLYGHDSAHVSEASVVVYSTAIKLDNPELLAAKSKGLELIHRGELLAKMMVDYRSVAVCGTHGKTTTTSLLAYTLLGCGLDPSFVIGGVIRTLNVSSHVGDSDVFVVEADESDQSFLHMSPTIGVLTNLDMDHLQSYEGCFDQLIASFKTFFSKIPENGLAILPRDDENAGQLIDGLKCAVTTYGCHPDSDYYLRDYQYRDGFSHFEIVINDHVIKGKLPISGQHNVLNAMPSLILGHHFGMNQSLLLDALSAFPGVGNRLEFLGAFNLNNGLIPVLKDYGHHPRAITVTLSALQSMYPDKSRKVLIFQPHRYSRLKLLFADFAQALSAADAVVLLPVYSAGETAIPDIDSIALKQAIVSQHSHVEVTCVDDVATLGLVIESFVRPEDVLLFQGAGSIIKLANELVKVWQERLAN